MPTTQTQPGDFRPDQVGRLLVDGALTAWGKAWGDFLTLRTSDARRAAWDRLHQVGPPSTDAPDVEQELETHGLSLDDAMALADALDQASRTPYQRAKAAVASALSTRCKRPAKELAAWHFAGLGPLSASEDTRGVRAPLFEDADLTSMVIRFFDGIGMNARGHVPPVDVPSVLATETLITLVQQTVAPMAERYASQNPVGPIPQAAIGMLLADATTSLDFVDAYLPQRRDRAALFADHFTQSVRHRALESARWALVRFHFDRARHRGDLDAHWWRLRKGFQGVDRHDAPDATWVGPVEGAPLSGVGCLLATTARIALAQQLRDDVGSTVVERFGAGATLIQNVFRRGDEATWTELVPDRSPRFWRDALRAD